MLLILLPWSQALTFRLILTPSLTCSTDLGSHCSRWLADWWLHLTNYSGLFFWVCVGARETENRAAVSRSTAWITEAEQLCPLAQARLKLPKLLVCVYCSSGENSSWFSVLHRTKSNFSLEQGSPVASACSYWTTWNVFTWKWEVDKCIIHRISKTQYRSRKNKIMTCFIKFFIHCMLIL